MDNTEREPSPTVVSGDGGPKGGSAHRTIDPTDSLFAHAVPDYGELHNDILHAFDRRHRMSKGVLLDEKAYRLIMVDAINEVLANRGIDGTVTLDDITYLAYQGHYVARASGIDLANLPADAHIRLLEFLRRTGRITSEEKVALLALIANPGDGGPHDNPGSEGNDIMGSPAYTRYRQVAIASRKLWTELSPYEPPAPGQEPIPLKSVGGAVFEWGFQYLIDAGYAAVIGGIAGAIIGAYYSGMVALVFTLDAPDDGNGGGVGGGDYQCPCCLCTGP